MSWTFLSRVGVLPALVLGFALLLGACSDEESPEKPAPVPVTATAPSTESSDLPVVEADAAVGPVVPGDAPPASADEVPSVVVEPEPVPPASPIEPPLMPQLAIIIDDVGQSLPVGRQLVALPGPVALAILPFLPHSQLLATEAAAAGKPVMLHLPMENMAGLSIGPGGLTTAMSEAEFRSRLQLALNAFSPIQGVNNHMGSRLTADRQRMDWLMQVLAERQLFFVDSRTTAQTQAILAAEAAQVPSVSRDVFLDNQRTEAEIAHEFALAVAKARKDGTAVLIGHPYPETLAYLERRLPLLEEEGVRLVSVQVLLGR
ncbi:divergent polysaccharide deacetylase family protein [Halopseudomonas aestusnigri]|uniref:divergent polysaccharide deacetylase family protein n=1 Tax=Halopseudomonas aestusnigri TaxID=857252 RepID=UPI0028C03456|nr:hypothetical protein YSKK_06290 [Halopseudomonas aestusnigri]